MAKYGRISKGYLKGPHHVCINTMQEHEKPSYPDKDVIKCSGPCRSSTDGPNYTSRLRVNEGNQYGEFDKISPVDPNKGKPLFAKSRKNSPFKRAKCTPVIVRK